MSYYQLPKTNILIHSYIDYIVSDETPISYISNSLSSYLYEIKQRLETIETEWDTYKKYTNPYEYIHTHVPNKKKCISKYHPLSRAYFKMIEIINTFDLKFDSKPITTFHLAEGPGGFIEAIANYRNCRHDHYIGMTILDDKNDSNIPAWKKTDAFLKNNPNVTIEKGKDLTGDILSLENFEYCKEKYGSSMDLITGDGGFDFSLDFNSQEINISDLLMSQIFFALVMQKKGGSFVLKMFDSFMNHTIDLLYILSSFYEIVYIIKPYTSRYANSEKYIVCKNFLYSNNKTFYPKLHEIFKKMVENKGKQKVHRFITKPIPYNFLIKIEEYNAIFGQQQLENIHYTMTLIENKYKQEKIDTLLATNISKCIYWCNKHNVPCNKTL
jgi:23S rRNA U2552 (ribose-2'-O)-methylase RlmE/FtsJ